MSKNTKSQTKKMSVGQAEVVDLLTTIGFKSASKWDRARLVAKLAKFDTLVDAEPNVNLTKFQTALCAKLTAAATAGKPVTVVSGWSSPAAKAAAQALVKGKAATSTKGKAVKKGKKAVKKGKKTTKAKKDTIPVNAFGHRTGTQADRMDSAFVKGGTVDAIAKASGASRATVLAHKKHLIGKKFGVTESKTGRLQLKKS